MDLQSLGDKPVTSRNACPPDNFRAYSPQISDFSRCQPDTSGLAPRFPGVAMEVGICPLSPLFNEKSYVYARAAKPPRVPESVSLIGTRTRPGPLGGRSCTKC